MHMMKGPKKLCQAMLKERMENEVFAETKIQTEHQMQRKKGNKIKPGTYCLSGAC